MENAFQGAYLSFPELAAREEEGRDFVVQVRLAPSPFAIIAPHGGKIEPGTSILASAIAGLHHNFYGFCGKKPQGNRRLHLPSTLFDDPRALAVAHRAITVVTVHGCRGDDSRIILGGADHLLRSRLLTIFRTSGIAAEPAAVSRLSGTHPANLCNRGRSGKGVQLELSRGLRERLVTPLNASAKPCPTPLFFTLVEAIQAVLGETRSSLPEQQ